MTVLFGAAGAWRASVRLGSVGFEFEESDRILERDVATRPPTPKRIALVEISRNVGMTLCALLSGRIVNDGTEWFSIGVAHSGPWPDDCQSMSVGDLGRRLCVGLPEEFAQAVADGLLRFEPEHRPAGRLEVLGGGFDLVGSSESIFEVAAGLLKWALLAENVTAAALAEFLKKLSAQA